MVSPKEQFKKDQNITRDWYSVWDLICRLKENGASSGHPMTTWEGKTVSRYAITEMTKSVMQLQKTEYPYLEKLVNLICLFRDPSDLFQNY